MKKKLLILLLTIFAISFIKMGNVYAASLYFECTDNTLEVGETTNCLVKGTVEERFGGITAQLGSNSHIQIVESTLRNISPIPPLGLVEESHIYYFNGTIANPGSYDITSFTVKAISAGTGTLTLRSWSQAERMGFVDESFERIIEAPESNYDITVTGGSEPESSDSSLAALVPNVGQLTPAFASDVYGYSMDVDFTTTRSVVFDTTTNEEHATVGNTTCNLPNSTSVESVTCNIVVTAQDESSSVYTISINNSAYEDPIITHDIFIETLTFDIPGTLIPTFKRDVYSYEMHINFSNYSEINFTPTLSETGITVTGKKCTIPDNPNMEKVTCNIKLTKNEKSSNYKIVLINTNRPDIKCDLVIKSNVYTIDQTNKIIRVNSEHSLETIKSNLFSSCGEISVYNDKVIITDGTNLAEYKLEKLIMPQTGNKKFLYLLACGSVLVIIGVFMFSKNYFFKKEELN